MNDKTKALVGDSVPELSQADLIKKAWDEYQSGTHENALALLQDALKKDRNSVQLHLELAKMYETQKNPNKMISHCAQALKISPRNSAACASMGSAYIARDESGKAAPFLRKALDFDPNNTFAYELLGRIVLNSITPFLNQNLSINIDVGDGTPVSMEILKGAIEYYQRGCRDEWQWLRAYYRMGMLYYHADNSEKWLETIIKLAKDGYEPAQEWLEELSEYSKSRVLQEMFAKRVDLRSDEERTIEANAQKSLEGENEELATKIIEFWQLQDTRGERLKSSIAEIRKIGEYLGANGGSTRMMIVAYRVQALGGSVRQLEYDWNGICGWVP